MLQQMQSLGLALLVRQSVSRLALCLFRQE